MTNPLATILASLSDEREPDMTARLFRGTTLVASVMLLGLVLPLNVVQGVSTPVHLAVTGFGLLSVHLYRRAISGRYLYVLFYIALLLALDLGWFGSAGSDGSGNMWLGLGAVTAMLFFRDRALVWALTVFVANGVALYLLERAVPSLVLPFRSSEARLVDMITGFVFSSVITAALVGVVLRAYRRERSRLAETVAELGRRAEEIRTLRGLLPICAWCKKVRTDSGLWTEAARYLESHPDLRVTHGLCPSCLEAQLAAQDADAKQG